MNEFKIHNCHDCGTYEGDIHEWNCDMEVCPMCFNQLIGCECSFIHFYLKYNKTSIMSELTELGRIYLHGLNDAEEDEWKAEIERVGRIPYLTIPTMCGLCGRIWPAMFTVEDNQWKKYVIPQLQDEVLCFDCWEIQMGLFPNGWRKASDPFRKEKGG